MSDDVQAVVLVVDAAHQIQFWMMGFGLGLSLCLGINWVARLANTGVRGGNIDADLS
ncbi:MAG: hypothetical protein E1N59_312 [Puniceicoccaceae bacterium 5H]|nr:MAG: hypothetical protein E1N59_312 [Puniceicoccaceae bacterium 5H]